MNLKVYLTDAQNALMWEKCCRKANKDLLQATKLVLDLNHKLDQAEFKIQSLQAKVNSLLQEESADEKD